MSRFHRHRRTKLLRLVDDTGPRPRVLGHWPVRANRADVICRRANAQRGCGQHYQVMP